jgi:hemoglobin
MIHSAGIDEASIALLVDRFYDKVRIDPLLGPVFNPVVHDWAEHKRLLTSFWASVILLATSYRGNPMSAHRPHPIRAEHFERWLALWDKTSHEILDAESAARMMEHTERIGRGLQLGLGLLDRPNTRTLGIALVGSGTR